MLDQNKWSSSATYKVTWLCFLLDFVKARTLVGRRLFVYDVSLRRGGEGLLGLIKERQHSSLMPSGFSWSLWQMRETNHSSRCARAVRCRRPRLGVHGHPRCKTLFIYWDTKHGSTRPRKAHHSRQPTAPHTTSFPLALPRSMPPCLSFNFPFWAHYLHENSSHSLK